MSKNNNQVVTFGCRLNIYESEIIKQQLSKVNDENIIVFNTCTVTKEAERQARQSIRKIKKENPSAKIIVTGCAAQTKPEMFAEMGEVNKVIGNEEKLDAQFYNLDDAAEPIIVNDIMSVKETAEHLVSSFDGRTRAFIQVQNGCDHRCTFCIIPYGRGNSRSVPIGSIVKQVKILVEQGFNEVVFTGVDVTAYGPDLPGKSSFASMIKRVLNLVPELKRLRLSSIDVAEIDDELFDLLANESRIMPYLHISLQAGDNMILKRMKRRHNREQVIDFCHKLRTIREDVSFGADIIAGFPTETDEMFENSLKLIQEAGLQFLHVFPYSERENTPAAKMPAIAKPIRKERARLLREAGEKELKKFQAANIGRITNIIMEKDNIGRAENFLTVKIDQNFKQGEIVKVKLIAIEDDKLIGQLINE